MGGAEKMSVPKIGLAEGECPRCGRVWRRERPTDVVLCDCYRYCPCCGDEMTPYEPDPSPRVYRSEDVDDPAGAAVKPEASVRTRLHCARCGYFSDGVPVEVRLR
jgi:hypothetical protein